MSLPRLANPSLVWQSTAVLTPLLVAGALMAANTYQSGRAKLEQDVAAAARRTSVAIDDHLAGIENRLMALAASPAFGSSVDQAALQAMAANLLQPEGSGAVLVLLDSELRQLAKAPHTATGSPQSDSERGQALQVLANARPLASGLYEGGRDVAGEIAVSVPVPRAGRVQYVLELHFPAWRLLEAVPPQAQPPGWVTTVLDREGKVAARNPAGGVLSGQAGGGMRFRIANAAEGAPREAVTAGPHAYTAYAQSGRSGWAVSVEAPRASLESTLRHSLALDLGVIAALLACSLAMSLFYTRHLRQALAELGKAIVASAGGDTRATAPRLGPPETLYLADQFNLMQQAQRQAKAQLRLAASVFSSSEEAIVIADHNGTIVDVNRAFTRLTGFSRTAALGAEPQLLRSPLQDAASDAAVLLELNRTGHWHGEIWVAHADGGSLLALATISAVRNDRNTLTHYVAQFADVTRQHEQRCDMERMAYYDPLTKLPNRRLLEDRLRQAFARAGRSGERMALACLDLDGFKPVNDSYGHEAGDLVLKTVAERLRAVLRPHDTAARLGGDEFVLLISDLVKREGSGTILHRVLQTLAEPIRLADNRLVSVSGSIGIALFPDDGDSAELLLQRADQAMYRAKRAGRNCMRYFGAKEDAATL